MFPNNFFQTQDILDFNSIVSIDSNFKGSTLLYSDFKTCMICVFTILVPLARNVRWC